MSKHIRRLVRGSFRALEADLIDHLKALRSETPLAPVAVVVPGEMLRVHLARALADAGCPHANIHFLTLHRFAERLAGGAVARSGLRPEPEFAARLLMGRVIGEDDRDLRYFRGAAGKDGLHKALADTLAELDEAGLTAADLAACVAHLPTDSVLQRKAHDLAMLWAGMGAARADAHFRTPSDLLRTAADEAADAPWLAELHEFVLYGWYDFTGLQRALLAACFDVAPSAAWFPWQESEAFAYAGPALAWLEGRGFVSQDAEPAGDGPSIALARLQRHLFSGAEEILDLNDLNDDAGVSIVSAPGEAREAEAIAREVIHPRVRSDGAPPRTTGVLLRGHELYATPLREAFMATGAAGTTGAAGVEGHFSHCLSLADTCAGRAMQLLAGLIDSPMGRARVMDFLAVAQLKGGPPVALWNFLSLKAGIVEGPESWHARLTGLADAKALREGDLKGVSPAQVTAFRDFVAALFADLVAAATRGSWGEMADAVAALYRGRIEMDDESEAVLGVLASLGELDAAGTPPTPDAFRALLGEAMGATARSVGRFQRAEPTVSPLMQARGVPFDLVIVPGLVEKLFPQAPRQDPILLDAERATLAEATGVDLPMKSRRRDEERLLFALAIGAARQRVVLTYPRLDAASGRARVPSWFLLRTVEALAGGMCDFAQLDKTIRTSPVGQFVQMSRLDSGLRLKAAHRLEYDLAAFGLARAQEKPEALAYLSEDSPFFARALEAESERYGKDTFTRFDGVLETPGVIDACADFLIDPSAVISPSRLEAYASCPFRFFLEKVLRAEALHEPEHAGALSPLDRGDLIHRILWEFLSRVVEQNELPLSEAHWPMLEAVAERRLARFAEEGVTGYPLIWRMETERILEDLREFLSTEVADDSGFQPAHFEVRFGMDARDVEESSRSTTQPAALELGGEATIRFRGKIDRVDVADGRCRVLDYKTGKAPAKAGLFQGGTALQLPVYMLAADQLLDGLTPEEAAYYYATARGEFHREPVSRERLEANMGVFRDVVRTIVDGIRAGRFFSHEVENTCRWCDARGVCRTVKKVTAFKYERDLECTRDYTALKEVE